MSRGHVELVHAPQLEPVELPARGWGSGPRARILSAESQTGAFTAVLELPPGYSRPPGRIAATTESLVIDGTLRIGAVERSFGFYEFAPAGSDHEPWSSETGATLLYFARDAPPDLVTAEGPGSLEGRIAIDSERLPWSFSTIPGPPDGHVHKVLRRVDRTGEMTVLLSTVPHREYPALEFHDCVEEYYVIEGGVWLGNSGQMTAGSYFWRPPFITHGPFYSATGALSVVWVPSTLVNHVPAGPDSTPEENLAAYVRAGGRRVIASAPRHASRRAPGGRDGGTTAMRAWRLHEVGSPAGLRLDEIPAPALGAADALVRVGAIGINSSELQIVTGYWEGRGIHSRRTLPFTIGLEGAGEVVAVGPNARGVAVGDRVAIHYIWSCGRCEDCVTGSENTCRHPEHFGRSVPGSYAELARVPAAFLVPLPEAIAIRDAAALFIAAATAWHMLVTVGRLAAGETVLVTGGSSGIGSAAIQVARLAGARVIATAGGVAKAERLRALGAEHVIDHREQPQFGEAVLELTGGRGVDVAYDAVGGPAFLAALAALRHRGRLVAGGYMGGAEVELSVVELTGSEAQILGSSSWTRAEARLVLELAAAGRLAPVIDSVFPFTELPRALERLASREAVGKVLVNGPGG